MFNKIKPFSFSKHKSFALETVSHNGLYLEFLPPALKQRDVVYCAVAQNGLALQFAPAEFLGDAEIVECAIDQNPSAFAFATPFHSCPEMVLYAVSRDGLLLKYATLDLLQDHKTPRVLDEVKGLRQGQDPWGLRQSLNDEIIIRALINNPQAIQYVKHVKKDFNIMMQVCKANGIAFGIADDTLKNNPSLIYTAVKQNGLALQYVGEQFKNYRLAVMAIKNNPRAIKYVGNDLRQNTKFIMKFAEIFEESIE